MLPKLFCFLIPDKWLDCTVILLLQRQQKLWHHYLRAFARENVIFGTNNDARQKEKLNDSLSLRLVQGHASKTGSGDLWVIQRRVVMTKRGKVLPVTQGRVWWERGGKSFQISPVPNSPNCSPNIIRASYQQARGVVSSAWLLCLIWAGSSSFVSVQGRPESALCVIDKGQWLGPHGGAGALGLRLSSLAWWPGVDNAAYSRGGVSHTCQITGVTWMA